MTTLDIAQIQIRRGTAAQWSVADPILGSGEFGLETDTKLVKLGDGTSLWSALTYQGPQLAAQINLASAKTTPVDADTFPLSDSAASNGLKKVSWQNIVATLKAYFDSVATTLTNKTLTSPVVTGLVLNDSSIVFEGTTADAFETTLTVTDPTADRTITLPNASGTVALTSDITDQTPLTTKGDLFSFSTVDARLPVGTNGHVLTADSAEATGLKWAAAGGTFVGCSVYASAAQSVTQNVATVVTLNTENYDTDGFHDNVTNNSRLTIPSGKDGKYRITVTGRITTVNQVGFGLYKNGSAVTQGLVSGRIAMQVSTSGYSAYPTGSFDIALIATDYLEIFCFCDVATGNNLEFIQVSMQFLGA